MGGWWRQVALFTYVDDSRKGREEEKHRWIDTKIDRLARRGEMEPREIKNNRYSDEKPDHNITQ